ncbi:MAG: sulfatase-like hydrolase/transferase, partial [Planctomycetes bacterium]|nr:sulfatase-like hydrolase/transferase [Planctomycetota bacterium]
MAKPANILFIECDSMDGRAMGCMGHRAAYTPNLDRLAKAGVMFRNMYSNNPICCPSRASMWSGRFTHNCEAWNNYKGLEEDTPTFATRLQAGGYRTQTYGKTDFLSGYHTIRARVSSWTRSANILRPAYRTGAPVVEDTMKERVHEADWNDVDNCIAWLGENAGKNEPFMLYCGIRSPHPAFRTSRRWLELIEPANVTVPAADESPHPVMEYTRAAKNWEHGFSDEMVRKVRRIYFAMIAEVDAMVGKLLDTIESMGLSETTYVIFTSDHGEMNMEHRQFFKMTHYEPSVRVPLIVAGPGAGKGLVVDELASLVDIYPTIMDIAGLTGPDELDGQSLMKELNGQEGARRDWVISEFHGETVNTGCFMLRRGKWKYMAFAGYEPMLFDLAEDPDELNNLAPTKPDVVKDMDERLRAIVDYEAVDAKVKQYDKRSFRQWRQETMAAGTYRDDMTRIYSGWENVTDANRIVWNDSDEEM